MTDGTAQRTAPAENIIVVDFAHYRLVRDMRKRLDDLGIGYRTPDPRVKL